MKQPPTLTELINVRVSPALFKALEKIAANQKRSVSFIAREMLEAMVKKAGVKL